MPRRFTPLAAALVVGLAGGVGRAWPDSPPNPPSPRGDAAAVDPADDSDQPALPTDGHSQSSRGPNGDPSGIAAPAAGKSTNQGPLLLSRLGAEKTGGKAGTNAAAASPDPVASRSAAQKESLTTTILDAETRNLRPRDTFRFLIKEDPDQDRDADRVIVTDGGEAMFPVSHRSSTYVKVNVVGKKLSQIRAEVKRLLDEEYYVNASIQLDFEQANRDSATTGTLARAIVFKALNATVPLPEGEVITLTDAVLKATPSEFADLSRVRLHRLDRGSNVETVTTYNVREMIDKGDRRNDVRLEDGDRIEVPEKRVLF